ncbi:hypothetical protein Tco_0711401 [Tanacetum coccineum]
METTKTTQAKEIANLQKRVKKLERKRKSRTPWMNLFKGKQKSFFEDSDFDEEFDADMDEMFKYIKGDAEQVISAVVDEVPTSDAVNTAGTKANTASAPVTTVGVSVSTAGENITTVEPSTPLTTTNIPDEEDLTIAQTLVKMRSEKSKERGVVMKEPSETVTRTTTRPQQQPSSKDKGKAIMTEPEKPLKKKAQIKFDEEVAQRLQAQIHAELEDEERLAKQREEDANIAEWDDVQAMMDADYELAARLQAQEQGELTIEERSKLFVELMDKRKKHFARFRAKGQKRKPLTKSQKRNQMCTYLKNMAGFTHNQLKNKSFHEL